MKLFIVTSNNKFTDAITISNTIASKYDMSVVKRFSTENSNYNAYDISIAFKNNAILSCHIDDCNNIHGIMMEDFYNSDIMYMNIEEFNSISTAKLTDVIVIWIDDNYKNMCKRELNEINILQKTLESFQYMYFNEPTDKILKVLFLFLDSTDDIKSKIIMENQ